MKAATKEAQPYINELKKTEHDPLQIQGALLIILEKHFRNASPDVQKIMLTKLKKKLKALELKE